MAKLLQNNANNGSGEKTKYVLALYVSGATPRSRRALANVKEICEQLLNGRYALEVVDIFQNPTRLGHEQVIAAPTLIRRSPLPVRRFIGDDLSDKGRLTSELVLSDTA